MAGDKTDDGEVPVVVGGEPLSSLLFSFSSNLSDHDDSLSLRVVHELFEHINKVSSIEGVSSDTDDGGLAESKGSGLVDSLVG